MSMQGTHCGLMDVTRTVRYEGDYKEAMLLQRMLEEDGVHVELPPEAQEQLERERLLARYRREQEQRERQEQLAKVRTLGRLAHEQQELEERHARERQELDERHARERQELDERRLQVLIQQGDRPSDDKWQVLIAADHNQVIINLVSTGTAADIAMAVKKFLKRAPHAKVEVEGEAHTPEHNSQPPPHPARRDTYTITTQRPADGDSENVAARPDA
jgi:hypothetical protein